MIRIYKLQNNPQIKITKWSANTWNPVKTRLNSVKNLFMNANNMFQNHNTAQTCTFQRTREGCFRFKTMENGEMELVLGKFSNSMSYLAHG